MNVKLSTLLRAAERTPWIHQIRGAYCQRRLDGDFDLCALGVAMFFHDPVEVSSGRLQPRLRLGVIDAIDHSPSVAIMNDRGFTFTQIADTLDHSPLTPYVSVNTVAEHYLRNTFPDLFGEPVIERPRWVEPLFVIEERERSEKTLNAINALAEAVKVVESIGEKELVSV